VPNRDRGQIDRKESHQWPIVIAIVLPSGPGVHDTV
jgi:hypothetical protein